MAAPDPQQARRHHAAQTVIVAGAVTAVARAVAARQPWPSVLQLLAGYQLAAATAALNMLTTTTRANQPAVSAGAFAGVSSHGFPVLEPLIASIDYAGVPAPAEAVPEPWWDGKTPLTFLGAVKRIVEGEVREAGRSAFGAGLVTSEHTRYIRLLVGPSCKRCVILAGRIYRDLDGFDRHPPTCDCEHWPVEDLDEAIAAGLVVSRADALERGLVRDLTDEERQAIDDGADMGQVVNASRGMYTANAFGQRVAATREGTKRSLWRQQNPSSRVRLRPEAIYHLAEGDRDVALRLLQENGYLL